MREVTTVRLNTVLKQELDKRAEAEGRTRSQMIERIIAAALKLPAPPVRVRGEG